MNILTIDPARSRNLGYAIWRDSELAESGTLNLSEIKNLYLGLADWLTDKIENYNLDLIAFERTSFGAPATIWGIAELCGIIKFIGISHNLDIRELSPSKIKKTVTGRGNAKKSEVIQAVQARGYAPQSDHEADAIAIFFALN